MVHKLTSSDTELTVHENFRGLRIINFKYKISYHGCNVSYDLSTNPFLLSYDNYKYNYNYKRLYTESSQKYLQGTPELLL